MEGLEFLSGGVRESREDGAGRAAKRASHKAFPGLYARLVNPSNGTVRTISHEGVNNGTEG
jgi:hypothetical protein